jgi:hypothetical protein
MKHLKILGLFVMAAAALMAFAGSASAATFTSPAGTEYTGAIDATAESSLLLEAGFAEITCTESTIQGTVTTNDNTEASGPFTSVSYSGCGQSTVDTLSSTGTLTIKKSNHEVRGSGVEVTTSEFGISCVYGLGAGTKIGTASQNGETVTMKIEANLPKISGGFFCASPASWHGTYLVTEPHPSFID